MNALPAAAVSLCTCSRFGRVPEGADSDATLAWVALFSRGVSGSLSADSLSSARSLGLGSGLHQYTASADLKFTQRDMQKGVCAVFRNCHART